MEPFTWVRTPLVQLMHQTLYSSSPGWAGVVFGLGLVLVLWTLGDLSLDSKDAALILVLAAILLFIGLPIK